MSESLQIKRVQGTEDVRLMILLAQKREGLQTMGQLNASLELRDGTVEAMFEGRVSPTSEEKAALCKLAGREDEEQTRLLIKKAMQRHGIKSYAKMDAILGCERGTTERCVRGREILSAEAALKLKALAGGLKHVRKMQSRLGVEAERVMADWETQGVKVEKRLCKEVEGEPSRVRSTARLEARDVQVLLEELRFEGVILLRVRNREVGEAEPGSVMGELESRSWRLDAAPLAPHAKNLLRNAVEKAFLPWG